MGPIISVARHNGTTGILARRFAIIGEDVTSKYRGWAPHHELTVEDGQAVVEIDYQVLMDFIKELGDG